MHIDIGREGWLHYREGECMRFITYPRVSWFLMELGVVRPAAMLGREQFNNIIHILRAKPSRAREEKEGKISV